MTRDELIEAMALAISARYPQIPPDMHEFQFAHRCRNDAATALTAIEAQGLAIVPVEATEEQIDAIRTAYRTTHVSSVSVMSIDGQYRNEHAREFAAYRAMIEAGKLSPLTV